MKKILFLFIFISAIAYSQMPNIEKIWLNDSQPYVGTIDKSELKLKMNISEQDRKNDQEYFVAGYTMVDGGNYSKFEGKIKIEKYKSFKKGGTVYGTYEFAEEPKGQHFGNFNGKFVYNFKWDKKTEKIIGQYIQFVGDWESYDQKMKYRTSLKNLTKAN